MSGWERHGSEACATCHIRVKRLNGAKSGSFAPRPVELELCLNLVTAYGFRTTT